MMLYMSSQLALVGLAVVPPVAGWAVLMGRKVKGVSREVQDALAEATQTAQERIANIRTVRAFAKEDSENKIYKTKMDFVLNKGIKEALIQAQFYGLTGLSGNLIILTVLFYGGTLVTENVLTVGNLTSFILYSAYVGIGINGVSTFYAEMMKGLGAGSRIWDIIDRVPRIPINDGFIPDRTLLGNIEFRNVVFTYPSRTDYEVLKDFSLTVPANKVLAVVGGSGSGKSTLASLILRFYDPVRGQIYIDGHRLSDLNPSWLRNQIGSVLQEPILFSGSIRENILYGLEESMINEKEMISASKEANAHEFISAFPDGYDTLVGERGIMLSGGQKQRIAITRAIIKNPHILILDEATSALDSASEHLVKEALDRIMKGRTVITIAHRLSTIRNADQIAVLSHGKIVESGKYDVLIDSESGYFRTLIEKQTFQV